MHQSYQFPLLRRQQVIITESKDSFMIKGELCSRYLIPVVIILQGAHLAIEISY